jgi:metallo-beta-lactamase family protein
MEIQFIGAAQQATGTCILFKVGEYQFLLDCGLSQGGKIEDAKNAQPFAFDVSDISAVILSSPHLSHAGLLPVLVKQGFSGVIYSHENTRDQVRIVLKEYGHLNECCAEAENRKRQRKNMPMVSPLYSSQESQVAISLFSVCDYEHWMEILPGVELCLFDAKYFGASSVIMLRISEGGKRRTIVYGGQLGDREGEFTGSEHQEKVDLVLLNSTFGHKNHADRQQAVTNLGNIFLDDASMQGNVLIPSPTIGRTQHLLHIFADHYEDWQLGQWQIILDNMLATEAKSAYQKTTGIEPEILPNLTVTRTVNQSKTVNKMTAGTIVLASTEMCTHGRIKHHLKHNAWNDKNQIILTEYQAINSIGREMLDGQEHVRLWRETVNVSAKIHCFYDLSGQADGDGMYQWFKSFQGVSAVALIEGEQAGFEAMRAMISHDSSARVVVPKPGMVLEY